MTYRTIQEREEAEFVPSTDSEWDRADARQTGSENPEQAWVLTDRDVWHRTPFYTGPAVPHPEDDVDYDAEPPVADQGISKDSPDYRTWGNEDDVPF